MKKKDLIEKTKETRSILEKVKADVKWHEDIIREIQTNQLGNIREILKIVLKQLGKEELVGLL